MGSEGLNALREASKLSVEVSELLRKPGATKRVELAEELPGLELEMASVLPLMAFDLLLESLVEGILVTGQVRGSYRLRCIRCLKELERPFEVEVSEVLAYEGSQGSEEGYRLEADLAPLEPIARDAVLLAVPLNPLCDPACRGLCPTCGADRNVTDCGHDAAPVDMRWEPLGRLRDAYGKGD